MVLFTSDRDRLRFLFEIDAALMFAKAILPSPPKGVLLTCTGSRSKNRIQDFMMMLGAEICKKRRERISFALESHLYKGRRAV